MLAEALDDACLQIHISEGGFCLLLTAKKVLSLAVASYLDACGIMSVCSAILDSQFCTASVRLIAVAELALLPVAGLF